MKNFLSVLSSALQGGLRGGLLILALLATTSLWAYDFQSGDLYYNITSDSTVAVTYQEYNSSSNYASISTVTIPETVTYDGTTYSVTSIGDYAFYGCSSLTSITIHKSVTSIRERAFENCSSLTSVTIPNNITRISDRLFFGCSALSSVTIPYGVISIGGSAFSGCSSLTSVTIPNSVKTIVTGAFRDCSALTSITIPEGVTSITNGTFSGCSSLTSVNIPNSVWKIGRSAFANCSSLASITIPNSVGRVESLAFAHCSSLISFTIHENMTNIESNILEGCSSLTAINVDSNNPYYSSVDGVLFNKDKTTLKKYPMGKSRSEYTIPNSVTTIGDLAFSHCSALTSITIPEGVTSIGDNAFYGCSSLTDITIPNSVTSIGDFAFYDCSTLTSINIPNSVTSIGGGTFYNCIYLSSITLPEGVTSIGESFCYNCQSLISITIPNSVTSIGRYAFCYCYSLASVTIGKSVTNIEEGAFYCNLEEIYCYPTTPPTITEENTFKNYNATLYVPCDSKEAYEEHPVFGKFEKIKGIDDCGGGFVTTHIHDTICQGEVYEFGEYLCDTTGTYTAIIGDVTTFLYLTVLPSSIDTITVEAYDSYEWHGKVYTESGVYTYSDPYNPCVIEELHLTIIDTPTPPEPEIPTEGIGVFSIGEGKTVTFSQGNLQYTQSTDTWSFAENQWDMIGTDNMTGDSVSSDPRYGDEKYGNALADKIDLFGWSTSTTNFGVNTSTSSSDYSGSFVDWGTNKIGNDAPNTWRTLTYDEWDYLLEYRNNASSLCGVAQVNGVNGLIFLPDKWTCPEGVTFKSGFHSNYGVDYYAACQSFTADQWSTLEAAGAVFLPASGSRYGSRVSYVQHIGYYWSASEGDSDYAPCLEFNSVKTLMYYNFRYYGQSVRLVKDVNSTTPEPPTQPQDTTIYHPTEYVAICEGDEFYWRGRQITEAGTHTDHEIVEDENYTYHHIYTLELSLLLSGEIIAFPTTEVTICENELPYIWNINRHKWEVVGAGTYTQEEILDCGGAIYTLELTVIPSEKVVLVEEAYDSYEWHGKVYTESGTYIYENFCSIEVLELTIIDTPTSPEPQDTTIYIYHLAEYATICEGETLTWRGMEYTETGTYTYAYEEIVEEDDYIYHYHHIYTLDLTVIPSETVVLVEEAYDSCEWHGEVYTESGTYTYQYECTTEVLYLTIIPSEDKEYVYEHHNYFVCDADIFVDPITGSTHVIRSLIPFSLTWSDTIIGTNIDTIHTFNITPIVPPEPLTEDILYAIGAVPKLVAGEMVNTTGTTEPIMWYYQMNDKDDIADVIGVKWVAGHDVVLDTEQTTHTMVLEVWDECDDIIPMEFTFPVSKKDSEPQDTTIYIYHTEDVTICEGEIYIWWGMEFTETGTYTYASEKIVEEDDYIYIYHNIYTLHLMVLPPTLDMYEVTAYDSYEWHGVVYTESGVYTYRDPYNPCVIEELHLTIIPSEDNQGEVVVEPSTNSVTITWQKEDDADTYIIVIKQGDKVVCTLIFDAEGNLVSVNYLPGRESNKHGIQHAGLTSDSFQYTITGLTPSTDYTYTVTATDDSDNTISSYSGEFTTHHATSVENTNSPSPTIDCQKILYEDHIYILRDGKTYTIMGQEI